MWKQWEKLVELLVLFLTKNLKYNYSCYYVFGIKINVLTFIIEFLQTVESLFKITTLQILILYCIWFELKINNN